MDVVTQSSQQVNPAARESRPDENVVEPMNDVFSISFVSKFDPYFTRSSTSDRGQGESAT